MKNIGILFLVLIGTFSLNAQKTELWGTTSEGCLNHGGIFKTDANGENFEVSYCLPFVNAASPIYSKFVEAANGKLYGLTKLGGIGNGCLFELDPRTNEVTTKVKFDNKNNGRYPNGYLTLAENGKLYGVTSEGGEYGKGVIFEYDPIIDTLIKLADFDGANGNGPTSTVIEADNGKLYGMAFKGGTQGLGVIFEFDLSSGTLSKKIDLDFKKGNWPRGALLKADNGKLYGMTSGGGNSRSGVLFEYDPLTNGYLKLVDFNRSIGTYPEGSLIQRANGKLYGMTTGDGFIGGGGIFEYDLSTQVYSSLVRFDESNGWSPKGSLIEASNGKLYGMTSGGGNQFGEGVVFQYDPVLSDITKVFSLIENSGRSPKGSLFQLGNDALYGMTAAGGAASYGVIFKIDLQLNKYESLVELSTAFNGFLPRSGLVQANNLMLYGLTAYSGLYPGGVLFEIDPVNNNFTKKFDFNSDINGNLSSSTMIQAKNDKLYGMTSRSGKYDYGELFEYDIENDSFEIKINFKGSIGEYPYGSLLEANNGKLYGMTRKGGKYNNGVLFEYDPATNSLSKKLDFGVQVLGKNPKGSLIQVKNGKLYGMTERGGDRFKGVLFEYDIISETYNNILSFYGADNGANPIGSLLEANNGKLYGMTSAGGSNNIGVLFEFNIKTGSYTKLLDFDGMSNGAKPFGSLIQGKNGNLYGVTSEGGVNDKGVLFEYDIETNIYTKKLDFEYRGKGSEPFRGLVEVLIVTTDNVNPSNDNDNFAKIYPNPVEDMINIEFEDVSPKNIILYSELGRVLYKKENISSLYYQFEFSMPSGIYFIEIISKEGKQINKLIKQ